MTDLDPRTILDTPMGPNDASAATIRDYLIRLLSDVWEHGEGFNGKRPFGNSGWEWELYAALAKAGHIHGRFDEDGYVEDVDTQAGHALIASGIKAMPELLADVAETTDALSAEQDGALADRERLTREKNAALDYVRRLMAERDHVARTVREFDPTGHDPRVIALLTEIREGFAIVEGQREGGEG